MRVVVITGSREWTDIEPIRAAVQGADLVLHGGAPGADAVAEIIAARLEINTFVMRAKWSAAGSKAGPNRNERMAVLAAMGIERGEDVECFAFPLPASRGTWDCVRRMRAHGVPTTVYGESEVP